MSHNGQDGSVWLSNPQPARLCYACLGQIPQLCIYYENYTMIWAVEYHLLLFNHVRPANKPTTRCVALCLEKFGRACRSGCR
jgi:hypothetical protein